jgi:hypothetical protein
VAEISRVDPDRLVGTYPHDLSSSITQQLGCGERHVAYLIEE